MNPCCIATIASLKSAQEVADILGITRAQVWRITRRLKIEGVRVSSMTLYTPEDVQRMRER